VAGTDSAFFQRLAIAGGGLDNMGIRTEDRLLSATMELTVDQVSELAFEMYDPNLAYIKSFGEKGPLGKEGTYADLRLTVAAFSTGPGPAGDGGCTLKMRPTGPEKSRMITGELNRENLSPSQFVADGAINVGMKWVVQDSAARPSITRDVGATDQNQNQGTQNDKNEWTTFQRLAAEEGFLCFESYNTLYFGSPQWLFDTQPNHVFGLGDSVTNPFDRLEQMPSIDVSLSKDTTNEISFELPLGRVGEIRPGHSVKVRGLPGHLNDRKLLVTKVSYPIAGPGTLSITARDPWVIEKQATPEQQAAEEAARNASSGGGGGTVGPLPGNTDGERACNAARSKLGTTYSWGGGNCDGPTKGIRDGGVADSYGDYNKVGFDCSGLMVFAWCQGSNKRVRLPRTTYDQRNAGPRIAVGDVRPGDLILMNSDGHVGMALGGGKMIEAPQSGDVVKISNVRGGYGVRIN
jgi:cell wall-associated NlpC family hydrolase